MSKRVFELAKELNTTSKRLMEKMGEINIQVKSHMSLLEDKELDRLYKHIGMVNRNRVESSVEAGGEEQPLQPESHVVRKSIPRIIRKTEIIIHDDEHDNKGKDKKKGKRSYVRTSSSSDGLMAGMRRGSENQTSFQPEQNADAEKHPKESEKTSSKKRTNASKAIKNEEEGIVGINPRGDRIRRPVDSILSIKKVSSRDEREKSGMMEGQFADTNGKNVLKESVEIEKNKAETASDFDNKGIQKDTVSSAVEKPNADMIKNNEEAQATETKPDKKETKTRKESTNKASELSAAASDEVEKADGTPEKKTREKENKKDQEDGQHKKSEVENRKDEKPRGREHATVQQKTQNGQNRGAIRGRNQNDRGYKKEDRSNREARSTQRDNIPSREQRVGRQSRPNNQNADYKKVYQDRNRDRSQGYRGRNDDKIGGPNKPLVIPKVNLAPGQPEEKNTIRRERRTAVTRDVEKGFKREAKKELPKKDLLKAPVHAGSEKNKDKYKKNYAVGHKARVKDMYSDDFVLKEFYDERVKIKKDKRSKRVEKRIPPKAVLKEITIPESITVKNLAEALKKTSAEVIKKLMGMGIMATLNQELDFETAEIIGDEFKVKVNKQVVVSHEDILFDEAQDDEKDLAPRAPVVVVMGHVDHGKTSLLDAIRSTHVADREAGGITQHIGAYKVNIHGRDITFLDTPGHEAFTAMRARGAKATDIAILVVAADDGVMPQTIEAINHAKEADVSLIVAINKIDKPDANPDRVKQELADRGVLIEEWGGDVIAVPVSAKKETNIDQLLEMVALTADVLELKANPNRQAKGIVIEAQLDKGRGPVATLLVQRGTLHSNDAVISGTTFGRIRAMADENGRKIEKAGPSTPIEVIGLDEVPEAGDVFYAISDEKIAKQLVDKRRVQHREQAIGGNRKVSLDDLFSQIKQGEVKELKIIIKADVQGSVEAVKQSLEKLNNEEVKVQVIHGGVGAINEADVTLADVSNAIIIGFNVRPPANVTEAAAAAGVDIRLYRVIYNAIEDIEKAMKGMLDPDYKEVVDGHVEIRQIFKASSVGTIGGGYVTDGKVTRNSSVRIVRNGIVAYEGKLASLKRFKDDVREASQGYECGILIDKFNDIKEGDVVEAFRIVEVERE